MLKEGKVFLCRVMTNLMFLMMLTLILTLKNTKMIQLLVCFMSDVPSVFNRQEIGGKYMIERFSIMKELKTSKRVSGPQSERLKKDLQATVKKLGLDLVINAIK